MALLEWRDIVEEVRLWDVSFEASKDQARYNILHSLSLSQDHDAYRTLP